LKARFLHITLIVFLLSSCRQSVYRGYSETDSGLFYKLQAIGDGKNRPRIGDYLQLRITYKTAKDSVFLDSYSSNETGMVILPFNHSSYKGSFEEGLITMNEGDSTSFIVTAGPLFKNFFKADVPFFLHPEDVVKVDVRLNRILNEKDYNEQLMKYKDLVADRDIEEQRKLHTFLDTNQTHFSFFNNGMYYLPLKQGAGVAASEGDIVQVNYTGYFLDGRKFESTYDRGQPLEFKLGEQGQVLKGIELAISLLSEGAKAKFIIPSQLAFGEGGSSTGIVPPYSTLVYEIELLNIHKK
jgi:FKBP-type peptidyl-prolyl cis-trans isomerase FkpA